MARRTKEDALATRHALLDAAERSFQVHGVARTSLAQIAEAAGLTRGAIYWHLKDKADLAKTLVDDCRAGRNPFDPYRRMYAAGNDV